MAGIIPGILIGLLLMITSYLIIKKKGDAIKEYEIVTFKKLLKTIYNAKWSLMAPIIILGGIYGGFFTPTEASVVAVVYALVVGVFIHKELNLENLHECFVETIQLMGATLYMIGLSVAFSYLLTVERIPSKIADSIISISDEPIVILLLINLFLLVVGAFIDAVPAIVILAPILLPVVTQVGIDPVHFGVIMIANLAIGYITPPVGVNLFVASAVGNVSIEKTARAMIPLILILLLSLALISYFPSLSLFVPNIMK